MKIVKDVLFGDGGYLFLYGGRQRQFDFLTGKEIPSEETISNFKSNVANRQSYCASLGIPFKHVVFPSKPNIKKRYIPAGVKVDSLYSKYFTCEGVLYPINRLLDSEASGKSTFRVLDTHMTDWGSFLVVDEILKDWFPNWSDGFSFLSMEVKLSGDLAKMSDLDSVALEERLVSTLRDGSSYVSRDISNFALLKSNGGGVQYSFSTDSVSEKKLLIFGDSFSVAALPFLKLVFREILYLRSDMFKPELVYLFKPDYVITATAERYLCKVRSDKEAEFLFFGDHFGHFYTEGPSKAFASAMQGALSSGFNKKYASGFRVRNLKNIAKIKISDFAKYGASNSASLVVSSLRAERKNGDFSDLESRIASFAKKNTCEFASGDLRQLSNTVFQITERSSSKFYAPIYDLIDAADFDDAKVHLLASLEKISILKVRFGFASISAARSVLFNASLIARVLNRFPSNVNEIFHEFTSDQVERVYSLLLSCYFCGAAEILRKYLGFDLSKWKPDGALGEKFNTYLQNEFPLYIRDERGFSIPKIWNSTEKSNIDVEFAAFIKGKRICIVGPAVPRHDFGKEIDTFDVVVRLSFVSNEISLGAAEKCGTKTNVSYFSAHTRFFEDQTESISKSVDFVCLTTPKFSEALIKEGYGNVREVNNKFSLPKGACNLLQSAIVDLLACNPASVHIYFANLFCSTLAYDPQYPSFNMLNLVSKGREHRGFNSITLLNHDPINNFLLMKFFRDKGHIKVDPELAKVLDYSVEQYMSNLETIYS